MALRRKSNFKSREQYWQEHISKWQRSGLTQSEYCKHNHLHRSTFAGWKKKLSPDSEDHHFVEVQLSKNIINEPVIEIELNKGVCLKVREEINPLILRNLIEALREEL